MKKSWCPAGIILVSIWILQVNVGLAQTQAPVNGAAKAPAKNVDFAPELDSVTAQLKEKFDGGKTNATDLKENLTAINALIAKHLQDGKRDQVARLYLLDAHIYADGMDDKNRAQAIWEQVARDFPGTTAAQGARLSLARMVPEGLEVGQRFPDFHETGLSASSHLGHVTLIDFWATWCGPCKEEMPNVISAYQTYHGQGFDIVGVSLDDDRDELVNFTRAQGMAWPQYFDGMAWQNKLAVKYGVHSIPMNYLLDRHGVIVGKGLRGSHLGQAVAGALAGK